MKSFILPFDKIFTFVHKIYPDALPLKWPYSLSGKSGKIAIRSGLHIRSRATDRLSASSTATAFLSRSRVRARRNLLIQGSIIDPQRAHM